jgi:hypothetical protein
MKAMFWSACGTGRSVQLQSRPCKLVEQFVQTVVCLRSLVCRQPPRRPPFPRAKVKYVPLFSAVFSGAKVCLDLCWCVTCVPLDGDASCSPMTPSKPGQTSLTSMCSSQEMCFECLCVCLTSNNACFCWCTRGKGVET